MKYNEDLIKKHYKKQAETDGDSMLSTIGERVVKEKEIELIRLFLQKYSVIKKKRISVLDAGCGNGYTLSVLNTDESSYQFSGLEFTEELYKIARKRKLKNCTLVNGDIRKTGFKDHSFDVVYTERCLINILDFEEQKVALREIWRILKPGGCFLMIEGFLDGLKNNNKARTEMGMDAIEPAYHNLYFEKDVLFKAVRKEFDILEPAEVVKDCSNTALQSNFLSTHYFAARVFQPLMTKGEWVRNTEFVKFFSFLPPIGNYSPIQAFVLRKKKANK